MPYIRLAERAMQSGLMTPHQMRDYIGLSLGQWRSYLQRAIIPSPKVKVPWARWPLYEAEQAPELKLLVEDYHDNYIHSRVDYWRQQREELKVFTQAQAASALHVPHVTFTSWIRDGKIPRPTHKVGCYMVYDEADLEAIRQWCIVNYRPRIQVAYETT